VTRIFAEDIYLQGTLFLGSILTNGLNMKVQKIIIAFISHLSLLISCEKDGDKPTEKKKTQKIYLIISIIVLSISCTNYTKEIKIDRTDEMVLIKEVINGAIGWAKNKDFTVSNRIIANDSNYLEVDPENRIVRGFKEFKRNEAFFADPRFKAIRYEIRDLKINLSQSGTVAWYYCVLDDINEWEGKPACWMNTRWTGVLEKREGKWVIVQMHFSFAKE
jgi:hypothetical protein